MPNDQVFSYVAEVLLRYKTANYLINNTYSSLRLIASKITSLLIHVHYSRDDAVPVPHRFLEKFGYGYLTSAVMHSLTDRDAKGNLPVCTSLNFLGVLGFLYVHDASAGIAREVELTPLGQAVVGGLSLFYKGKYPQTELELKPGDLTVSRKDYGYYEKAAGFFPDRYLLDDFLSTLPTSTIDLTAYVKDFREAYPILGMSQDAYRTLVMREMVSIQNNDILDFKAACDFDRDMRMMTSGAHVQRLAKRGFVLTYENIWRLSYTGRLFQRGGFQGISKKSKTLVHKDYINYDIPNSQLRLLVQFLEDIESIYGHEFTKEDRNAFLDLDTLKTYIEEPEFRESLIRAVGVPKEDWKRCMYALIFGAKITNTYHRASLGRIIFKNGGNPRFNKDLLLQHLDSLWGPIQLWFKFVDRHIADFRMTPLQKARFNRQCVGFNINPDDYVFNGVTYASKAKMLNKKKSQMSAFFLQGVEASFILHLMVLVPSLIVSYEFDGIVVDQSVEEELLNEARRNSGFRSGSVLVKDFE